MKGLLLGGLLLISGSAWPAERIISLGSAVTEMLYALGEGGHVVGVDSSSTYPPAAQALPRVGYHRQLGAEGLLSLRPDLVIGTRQAGPPETFERLRQAGVEVVLLDAPQSLEAALMLLQQIADLRGRTAQGQAIVNRIRAQIEAARAAAPQDAPRVLAVLAGQGSLMAAGRDSAADLMIRAAGGVNAGAGFSGYKPLGAESLLGLQPDALLVPSHILPLSGGLDNLLGQAGLAQTPAGRNRRVVVMDSALLLGLGPRLGEAIAQLATQLKAVEAVETGGPGLATLQH
ncbi:MAG: hemin ABC transporter substrate-binding protein [Gammaproteobacteria bacterium]